MQDRFTAIVALSILAAFLFVAFAFLWEGTLEWSFAAFRKMPKKRQFAVLVAAVLLGLHAFAKNGPLMGFHFGSTPNVEAVSENVRRGGHALVRTKTNVELDLAPPSGAITNDDWLRSGAHEDWFQIVSSNGWRFRFGTNPVDRLFVSSSGIVSPGLKMTDPTPRWIPDDSGDAYLAPFHTSLGIAPEANWPLLAATNSLFWRDVTSNGSLRLTWYHALLGRDTNAPVSFQAELFPSGDFIYRYDFSLLPEGFWSNPPPYAIGYQNNGGGETWTNADGVATAELEWSGFGVLPDDGADADNDGLGDYEEIHLLGTDPTQGDSDGDGLVDGEDDAPNHCDADEDGIPDGVDEYDWEHNTLLAQNAGYTNLVLTVVQGMTPPAQNAPRLLRGTPNASVPTSAMLDIGGLKIPAYTGTAIPLGIPYGSFYPFTVSIRGNLFVEVQLSTAEALYADGDTRIFTGGTSASGTGRLAFPRLYLVPQSDSGLTCLHEGDSGIEFRAILQPVGWSEAVDHAVIEGFELRDNGRLWLAGTATQRPGEISDGTVTLYMPWLFRGTLSESASVHWCEHGGAFCYACGVSHADINSCSHEATCAAKYDIDAECTCSPIFVRVNSDDDNFNGVEDRVDSKPVYNEDDLAGYVARGRGCCCVNPQGARARMTGISSGLRLWDSQYEEISSGSTITDGWFSVEATTASPTIGGGSISYNVLKEDGSMLRSITRRFTMANVQIKPDIDDDGNVDDADAYYRWAEGYGDTTPWLLARRSEPYKVVLQNECPADADLVLSLSSDKIFDPLVCSGIAPGSVWLSPDDSTNAIPFCARNASHEIYIDASGTNSDATLTYSIDFGTEHSPLSTSIDFRVVDTAIPTYYVRPGDLASVVYDYSDSTSNIDWYMADADSGAYIASGFGGTFSPPANLPLGDYRIYATFFDVWQDGLPYWGTESSGILHVVDVAIERETYAIQTTTTNLTKIASLLLGNCGTSLLWQISPEIEGGPTLIPESNSTNSFYSLSGTTNVWIVPGNTAGEFEIRSCLLSNTNIAASARLFALNVNINADYYRLGYPADSPLEEAPVTFFASNGAIVFTNMDDDDNDGNPDADATKIDCAEDLDDITTFYVEQLGVDCSHMPTNWSFSIQVQTSNGNAFSDDFQIFPYLAVGATGGTTVEFDHENLSVLSGTASLAFGIESRTPGASALVKCRMKCDDAYFYDSFRVLSTPFIAANPSMTVTNLYVSHSSLTPIFDSFTNGCANVCDVTPSTILPYSEGSSPYVYIQDHVEFGYTMMPTNHAVQKKLEFLLGISASSPDFMDLMSPDVCFWGKYFDRNFGNFVVSPTDLRHPFGVAICGTNFGYLDFLNEQAIQVGSNGVVSLDVSWLEVPHVDNVVSFIPFGENYKVFVADVELAKEIVLSSPNGTGLAEYNIAFTNLLLNPIYSQNLDVIQNRLDLIRAKLISELGISSNDVVRIPVAFDVSQTTNVRTICPNLVNLQYIQNGSQKRVFIPDPGFEPFLMDGARGIMVKLHDAGITEQQIFVVPTAGGGNFPFRNGSGGDVHCISNPRYSLTD